MQNFRSRRGFLAGLSATAALGLAESSRPAAAEPPPETTTVRLPRWLDGGAYCWAAEYFAGELLSAEGFTDVRYVQGDTSLDNSMWLAHGDTDFDMNMPSMQIKLIDAGVPIKILTGLHTGCFELIASDSVRSLTDLRGRTVGAWVVDSHPQILTTLMIAYVGLDPERDIVWITDSGTSPVQLFIDGKVDAVLAASPVPLQLRERKIGHTIVSNALDAPWSQYFCCMLAGSADYVERYPVATKRVLRAMLKAADLCASSAPMVAQQLVDRGYLARYDYAVQTLNDIRYGIWRDYDAADSVRFYALRMQETGMIKSSPQKIMAEGTDWRFLNELKRELKT
jgi:NitT/TauT family transport system substrate-binding protein